MKTGRRSSGLWIVVAVLLLCGAWAGSLWATEGGGGAYPNGAEGFMAGAVPPPGNYFLNYMTYYTAGSFESSLVPPDFEVSVFADVIRYIHVTPHQVLGGYWAVQAFLPIVSVDATVGGKSDSTWGIGDIIVDPFILSWHSKNWHAATGVDVFIPNGTFDAAALVNTSRGYWTIEPIAAFTYLSDSGFEVSSKFMYDINHENDDTHYHSGQEFHVDYCVAQKLGNWTVGLGGYGYVQTTDDEVSGVKVGTDGFKGSAFAIGPEVKFDHGKLSFIAAWQSEVSADNRPKGDKLWFKFICPL